MEFPIFRYCPRTKRTTRDSSRLWKQLFQKFPNCAFPLLPTSTRISGQVWHEWVRPFLFLFLLRTTWQKKSCFYFLLSLNKRPDTLTPKHVPGRSSVLLFPCSLTGLLECSRPGARCNVRHVLKLNKVKWLASGFHSFRRFFPERWVFWAREHNNKSKADTSTSTKAHQDTIDTQAGHYLVEIHPNRHLTGKLAAVWKSQTRENPVWWHKLENVFAILSLNLLSARWTFTTCHEQKHKTNHSIGLQNSSCPESQLHRSWTHFSDAVLVSWNSQHSNFETQTDLKHTDTGWVNTASYNICKPSAVKFMPWQKTRITGNSPVVFGTSPIWRHFIRTSSFYRRWCHWTRHSSRWSFTQPCVICVHCKRQTQVVGLQLLAIKQSFDNFPFRTTVDEHQQHWL